MSDHGQLPALIVILFLSLSLVTVIGNALTVRRFDRFPPAPSLPRLSVLVPARNEIGNIEACLTSLLSQDYPNFEVLALDDHSTDGTLAVLTRLAAQNPRLRVLAGRPLPQGWLGKHWACHQLSQAADGELLLFTDADTCHAPSTLRDSASALIAEQTDLLTAFPRQQVLSWGERLIVPVISFGIFSFLPIRLVRRLRWPALSVTIGQFMLFRRRAYQAIGGYESVRSEVVDDVALGRRILEQGFEWRLLDATRHVTCRMYHNFPEVVEGFSKNIFAFFDHRILPFFTALALVGFTFLKPPLVLISWKLGVVDASFPPGLAALAVLESLLLWWVAYQRFRFPAALVVFYPLSLTLFILVALRSFVLTLTGTATWKDRRLERVAMRWF